MASLSPRAKSIATWFTCALIAQLIPSCNSNNGDFNYIVDLQEAVQSRNCEPYRLRPGQIYHLRNNLYLPPCGGLQGNAQAADVPSSFDVVDFKKAGAIIIGPNASIVQNSSSTIENLYLIYEGVQIPASDASTFGGTAIMCPATGRIRGPKISHVMAVGFKQALACSTADSVYIDHFFFDSINGVFTQQSFDSSYYSVIRGWPYASVGWSGWMTTDASGTGSIAKVSISGSTPLRVGTAVSVTGATPASYNTGTRAIYTPTAASGTGTTATLRFLGKEVIPIGSTILVSGVVPVSYNTAIPVTVIASGPGAVSYTSRAIGSMSIAGTILATGQAIVTASSSGSFSYMSIGTGPQITAGVVKDDSHSLSREGNCVDFEGQQDDTHIQNAICFGYFNNFIFKPLGNIFGDDLWSDGVPYPFFGSSGFLFGGSIGRSTFGKLSANGQTYAVKDTVSTGAPGAAGVDILHLFAFTNAPSGTCINVDADAANSYLTIHGLEIAGCPSWAIDDQSNSVDLMLMSGAIRSARGGNTKVPYINVAKGNNSKLIQIDARHVVTDQVPGTPLVNGSLGDMTIAAANTIALPSFAESYALAGTEEITSIAGGWGGREITFTCKAACLFVEGGNLSLADAKSFKGASGAQIKFRYDDNNFPGVFREQWRSNPKPERLR